MVVTSVSVSPQNYYHESLMDACEKLMLPDRCQGGLVFKCISSGGHESLCLASELECYHENLMELFAKS